MKVYQRDIVEVSFPLPNDNFKIHPALVISTANLLEQEGFFYAVMLSTKQISPDFIFEISPEMLTYQTTTISYAKCQLIQAFHEKEVFKKTGQMRIEPFQKLLLHLNRVVFGIDFSLQ